MSQLPQKMKESLIAEIPCFNKYGYYMPSTTPCYDYLFNYRYNEGIFQNGISAYKNALGSRYNITYSNPLEPIPNSYYGAECDVSSTHQSYLKITIDATNFCNYTSTTYDGQWTVYKNSHSIIHEWDASQWQGYHPGNLIGFYMLQQGAYAGKNFTMTGWCFFPEGSYLFLFPWARQHAGASAGAYGFNLAINYTFLIPNRVYLMAMVFTDDSHANTYIIDPKRGVVKESINEQGYGRNGDWYFSMGFLPMMLPLDYQTNSSSASTNYPTGNQSVYVHNIKLFEGILTREELIEYAGSTIFIQK